MAADSLIMRFRISAKLPFRVCLHYQRFRPSMVRLSTYVGGYLGIVRTVHDEVDLTNRDEASMSWSHGVGVI